MKVPSPQSASGGVEAPMSGTPSTTPESGGLPSAPSAGDAHPVSGDHSDLVGGGSPMVGGLPMPSGGSATSELGGQAFMGGQPSDENQEIGQELEFACDGLMPYASELISFEPGNNAGFGQSKLPGVVLGPPDAGPPTRGSLDVLTLGTDGVIILGFGDYQIVNGPGPDFIVWENPFWLDGDSQRPFAELGEVSVSADGETWHAFPCNPSFQDGFDPGCAGWRPRLEFDPCMLLPIQPELSGGDPFDLAELGLESARFVRIRDLSDGGASPTAGFDLDAVGAIHFAE